MKRISKQVAKGVFLLYLATFLHHKVIAGFAFDQARYNGCSLIGSSGIYQWCDNEKIDINFSSNPEGTLEILVNSGSITGATKTDASRGTYWVQNLEQTKLGDQYSLEVCRSVAKVILLTEECRRITTEKDVTLHLGRMSDLDGQRFGLRKIFFSLSSSGEANSNSVSSITGSTEFKNGLLADRHSMGYVFTLFNNDCPYVQNVNVISAGTKPSCVASKDIVPGYTANNNCMLASESLKSLCPPPESCPCDNDKNKCDDNFFPKTKDKTSSASAKTMQCYACHAPSRMALATCQKAVTGNNQIAQTYKNTKSAKLKQTLERAYGEGSYICAIGAINDAGTISSSFSPWRVGCMKIPTDIGPRPYPRIAKADSHMRLSVYPAAHLFVINPYVAPFRNEDQPTTPCEDNKAELGEDARGTFFRPKIKIKLMDVEKVMTFTPSSNADYGSTDYQSGQKYFSPWQSEQIVGKIRDQKTCSYRPQETKKRLCVRLEFDEDQAQETVFSAYLSTAEESDQSSCATLESQKKLLFIGSTPRPPLKYKPEKRALKIPLYVKAKDPNSVQRYPLSVTLDPSMVPTDIANFHNMLTPITVEVSPSRMDLQAQKLVDGNPCAFIFMKKICVSEHQCTPLDSIDPDLRNKTDFATCKTLDCQLFKQLAPICTHETYCDKDYISTPPCQDDSIKAKMLDLTSVTFAELSVQTQWQPMACISGFSIPSETDRKLFGDYGDKTLEYAIQMVTPNGTSAVGRVIRDFEKLNEGITTNIVPVPGSYFSDGDITAVADRIASMPYQNTQDLKDVYFQSNCQSISCIATQILVRERTTRELGLCVEFASANTAKSEIKLEPMDPDIGDRIPNEFIPSMNDYDRDESYEIKDFYVPLGCRYLDVLMQGPGAGGKTDDGSATASIAVPGATAKFGVGILDTMQGEGSSVLRVLRTSGSNGKTGSGRAPFISSTSLHSGIIFSNNNTLMMSKGSQTVNTVASDYPIIGATKVQADKFSSFGLYNASSIQNAKKFRARSTVAGVRSGFIGSHYEDKRDNSESQLIPNAAGYGCYVGKRSANTCTLSPMGGINITICDASDDGSKRCNDYYGVDVDSEANQLDDVTKCFYKNDEIDGFNMSYFSDKKRARFGTGGCSGEHSVTCGTEDCFKNSYGGGGHAGGFIYPSSYEIRRGTPSFDFSKPLDPKCLKMCPRSGIKTKIGNTYLVCEYGGARINLIGKIQNNLQYDSQMPFGGFGTPTHCFDADGKLYLPGSAYGIQKCLNGTTPLAQHHKLHSICAPSNTLDSAIAQITTSNENYFYAAGTACDDSDPNFKCNALRFQDLLQLGSKAVELQATLLDAKTYGRKCLKDGHWSADVGIGAQKEIDLFNDIPVTDSINTLTTREIGLINTKVTARIEQLKQGYNQIEFMCPTINPNLIPYDRGYSLNGVWDQTSAGKEALMKKCIDGFAPYSSNAVKRKCSEHGTWQGITGGDPKPCLLVCDEIQDVANNIKWPPPKNYSDPTSIPECMDYEEEIYHQGVKEKRKVTAIFVQEYYTQNNFRRRCNVPGATDPLNYIDVTKNYPDASKLPSWGPAPQNARCLSASFSGSCEPSRNVCYDGGIDKDVAIGWCTNSSQYNINGIPTAPPGKIISGTTASDFVDPFVYVLTNRGSITCTFKAPTTRITYDLSNITNDQISTQLPFMPKNVPMGTHTGDYQCNTEVSTNIPMFSSSADIGREIKESFANTKLSSMTQIPANMIQNLRDKIVNDSPSSASGCTLNSSDPLYSRLSKIIASMGFCDKVCFSKDDNKMHVFQCHESIPNSIAIHNCINACSSDEKTYYFSDLEGISDTAPQNTSYTVVSAKRANSQDCLNIGLASAFTTLRSQDSSINQRVGSLCDSVSYKEEGYLENGYLRFSGTNSVFVNKYNPQDKSCTLSVPCLVPEIGSVQEGSMSWVLIADDNAQTPQDYRFTYSSVPIGNSPATGSTLYRYNAQNVFFALVACHATKLYLVNFTKPFSYTVESSEAQTRPLEPNEHLENIISLNANDIIKATGVPIQKILDKSLLRDTSNNINFYLNLDRVGGGQINQPNAAQNNPTVDNYRDMEKTIYQYESGNFSNYAQVKNEQDLLRVFQTLDLKKKIYIKTTDTNMIFELEDNNGTYGFGIWTANDVYYEIKFVDSTLEMTEVLEPKSTGGTIQRLIIAAGNQNFDFTEKMTLMSNNTTTFPQVGRKQWLLICNTTEQVCILKQTVTRKFISKPLFGSAVKILTDDPMRSQKFIFSNDPPQKNP